MESIEKKVALVTGAGGSVGSYITRSLLNAGCKTALLYRSDKHEDPLSKVKEEYPAQVALIQADLAVESEAASAVKECITEFDQVDYLVNPVGGWLSN